MSSTLFSGYAIFCDDIRKEAGGKITLVGVYRSIMYIRGDLPFTIPKFGVAIRYREPRDGRADEVTLRIFLPGDNENAPTIRGQFPMQQARETGAEIDPDYIDLNAEVVLSPLVIRKEGSMKVKVQCGAEELNLGTLIVKKAERRPATHPKT
jgi:hypothetical protein